MQVIRHLRVYGLPALLLCSALTLSAWAQTCLMRGDVDPPVQSSLENAARHYFDLAAKGDFAGLKQNSIPTLAGNFSGIESAVQDSRSSFAGAQAQPRPPFLLKVEGDKPLARSEFLCGVFGKNGQTADSAAFVIPNLAPGTYAVVTLDISSAQKPQTVSFVLQQQAAEWKIGGLYIHPSQLDGHDAQWFADKARAFQSKGQTLDAWLYFVQARELAVPVPFMYTQMTDKLYDESQAVKPGDCPVDGKTVDFTAGGKTYQLTTMFAVAVGQDLDVVVKYQSADISHTSETFKDNMALIHAFVAKHPELRDAFGGVVARAVAPSGQDYGSMLPMKEIK